MTPPAFARARVDWQRAWRIIPSKYPPIQLFEDLTHDPADWELLAELESAVNPRVRQELGAISLVPPELRVRSTAVMAAFVHLNPLGSRFSDGRYGVYYAAQYRETAIRETVYHLEQRLRAGAAVPDDLDQRVYVGAIVGTFVDLTRDTEALAPLMAPDDYEASRRFAAEMRAAGEDGIVYVSVRHPGHKALAVFRAPCISPPVQERHLRYHWDGSHILRYFDYASEEWFEL
ncbi:MAG: RES family NAD+ phosphorylase [Rhodospirillales bacterium]|nr:RES family NAD+ phosphorylase [Rhodospirillales bacterium]